MIRIGTALALGLAVVVASCATGYGPRGFGGGYTDEKLGDNRYRVKFDGNGHASSDRVWSFWMYRCAELTKEKGYTHFTLLRPGQSLSDVREPAPLRQAGLPGQAPGHLVNTKGGGYVYVPSYGSAYTITTWHTHAIVSMHSEPLPEYVVVLKAESVLEQLGPYIQSDGTTPVVSRTELYRRAATINRPATNYNFGGPL